MKNQLDYVEEKLLNMPVEFGSDEKISQESVTYNLNILLGYFLAQQSQKAANTIWMAEQMIKNSKKR